jgi:hypothetical protein
MRTVLAPYPSGPTGKDATPVAASANGTTGSVSAVLPAGGANVLTYISGFEATFSTPTAAITITVTVATLIGSVTLNYTVQALAAGAARYRVQSADSGQCAQLGDHSQCPGAWRWRPWRLRRCARFPIADVVLRGTRTGAGRPDLRTSVGRFLCPRARRLSSRAEFQSPGQPELCAGSGPICTVVGV